MTANKNVDQRFWSKVGRRAQNPGNGLVVQSHVTRDDRFEFYMIAHKGPTGLQSPVRFDVLALENWPDLDPKDLYDLTYNLCFGFYNYQGAVKLPAPLMYAHTLANMLSKINK